jgi:hypothetical protein
LIQLLSRYMKEEYSDKKTDNLRGKIPIETNIEKVP